jgi:hypothetical protein
VGHMQTVSMWREASGAAVSLVTRGTLQVCTAVMLMSVVKTCINAVKRQFVDLILFAWTMMGVMNASVRKGLRVILLKSHARMSTSVATISVVLILSASTSALGTYVSVPMAMQGMGMMVAMSLLKSTGVTPTVTVPQEPRARWVPVHVRMDILHRGILAWILMSARVIIRYVESSVCAPTSWVDMTDTACRATPHTLPPTTAHLPTTARGTVGTTPPVCWWRTSTSASVMRGTEMYRGLAAVGLLTSNFMGKSCDRTFCYNNFGYEFLIISDASQMKDWLLESIKKMIGLSVRYCEGSVDIFWKKIIGKQKFQKCYLW